MKEYRIVCTLDTISLWNGAKTHLDAASCWFNGRAQSWKTHDGEYAKKVLDFFKRECAKFDAESRTNPTRDSIIYTQSNIRLQSREVTEWEDE